MVFLHIQSGYLYTIKLFQVNIYTFDHILIFTKTLAEKPPPPQLTPGDKYLSLSFQLEFLKD